MPELARGLVASLSELITVSVYTKQESDHSRATNQEHPVLTMNLEKDVALLRESNVDAWLAMNAGLMPLGHSLSSPFFTYAHGNDFLQPWIPYG
ncbi:MAG: hypothetical protein WBO53_15080, partial [Thermoanaerobaculia bacterium]